MLVLLVPIFLLISLSILLHHKWKVPRGFPPGPLLPLPVMCNLPFTRYWGMNKLAVFEDLRLRYGDLYSIHLGHRRVVMMTTLEQAQEIFAKKINLRPVEIVNNWRDKRYGVIFSNGDDWKAQRKLFVSTVKSSGFGRGAIEQAVDLFWPKMRAVVASQPDEDGYLSPRAFDRALTEFIVFVFADPGSFPGGQPREKALELFNISRLFGIQWSEFELWYRFPILRVIAPKWSGYNKSRDVLKETHKELRTIVKQHNRERMAKKQGKKMKPNLDAAGEPIERKRDFVDIYLDKVMEGEKIDTSGLSSNGILDEHGMKCAIATLDNILVGGDGIWLTWYAVLFLLGRYPLVQDTIRRELLSVLGPEGRLNLDEDKDKLPYTRAFLMESIRFTTQSGYGAPHQIEGKEPVRIGKYSIPPGVDVYPGLRFIMFDEDHWDNPHEFRPERFIDHDTGQVILNNPRYVPFQLGPRACPGRHFAMDAMLALIARLAREYRVDYGRRINELRKGVLEGSGDDILTLDGKAVDRTRFRLGDEDEMELIGMALVTPKPFTVKITHIDPTRPA